MEVGANYSIAGNWFDGLVVWLPLLLSRFGQWPLRSTAFWLLYSVCVHVLGLLF